MKMQRILLFLILLTGWNVISAQIRPDWCIQNAIISVAGGQSELYFCDGDGIADQARFRVTPFAQPFAYLVTDEKNIILLVSRNNTINFEGLGDGRYRVWAFSYLGNILAQPGQDATMAVLADICFGLTQNFIPVGSIEPDGGTVSTTDGRTSLFACPDNANSEIIAFRNTSTDPFYSYVVTDENNIILAFANNGNFDFASLTAARTRVWGVSYIGNIQAKIGDNITTVNFASGCFDLSDNFVTVTRARPDGGRVALATGETSKTICAESVSGDVLRFISQTTAQNPYAFVITDENGIVITVLDGNTADFRLSAPGICRVYGVSFTGALRVKAGDNINTFALSDDCFDLSDNFVTIIKREVDGATVRLASGGNSATVCVAGGVSEVLTFTTTSAARSSQYVYLVTNQNNIILAIAQGNSFNFANLNARELRVWGLSFSGTLQARVGDNAATAPLSNECYDLSDNFIAITRKAVDGGIVSTEGGTNTATACLGDGRIDIIAFRNTSTSLESYIYLITDETGMVIGFINGHQFDFETLTVPIARVYGLSYSGSLTIRIGDNINFSRFAGECADLSDNFVTITAKRVSGGTVRLTGSAAQEIAICSGDGSSGILNFAASSNTGENYVFVITNISNEIIAVAQGNAYDFSGITDVVFRVWGLAYSGVLTARPGDNAARANLSNECFKLSDNFITVTRNAVNGATVQLNTGGTEAVFCKDTRVPGVFSFRNTSQAGNYAYLLTNENNIVQAITTGNSFDLTNLPAGVYRVWGVSYRGILTVRPGDNAGTAALADICFDLSDNFITLNAKRVNGGTVSLQDGNTSAVVCGLGNVPGQLNFRFQTDANADYFFVITDPNNGILAILNGNSVSFNGVRVGEYRVWGVSYTGDITARAGQNLLSARLASECFDVSDNFVSVRKEDTDGGAIAAIGGATTFNFCPGNGKPDRVELTTTGNSSRNYTFVLTDDNNNFIAAITGRNIDFDTLPVGVYRIWGLAYTGNLLVRPGDNAATTRLSNECFDLSDNFIRIVSETPDGGTVSLPGQAQRRFTCPADGKADVLELFRQGNRGTGFVFLITDENNIIEAITTESRFDFERSTEGVSRVWGLAYTGNLTAKVGDNAATTALSDDCFDLSNNFVEVIREKPIGGDVFLQNGDTIAYVCGGNATSTLKFDSTGTSRGSYVYVITGTDNVIRNGIIGDEFDFSFLPLGTYRVWGLAYTGRLIAAIGDVVTNVPISDDCFELSDTYATVVVSRVDGGTVATATGAANFSVCIGDGVSDVVRFDSISTGLADYVYLVTNKNNEVLAILTGDSFDFETLDVDTARVWGLSYSGELLVKVGDNAATATLASGCASLSRNFVVVARLLVNGGRITSDRNTDEIFVCLRDGLPDIIRFSNNSTAGANYIYVLTNENNLIRGTITGSQFDFETAGVGVSRVWGVSYTGQFTGAFGANLFNTRLSSGCFNVSDNFITVSRDTPLGGDVSTADGRTSLQFCPSPRNPTLNFRTSANRRTGYAFVVTNTSNTIVAFSTNQTVNFQKLPVGNYRVWGLSYTGNLQLKIGDNILGTDPLATSCFELAGNFVQVYRATLTDGGRVTNLDGPNTIYVCPNNSSPDIVVLDNDSEANDAKYRYILTNGNNIILSRNLESDVIDFNGAQPGIYRIWGVSFTGNFTGVGGDNAATAVLADSCYQLSENYILAYVDTPNGGTISTIDSLTSLSIVLDDDRPDVYRFRANGASIVLYQFYITDNTNRIIEVVQSDSINFERFRDRRNLRIWGAAYTGNLTAKVGDVITSVAISDDCFDLSDNFIPVVLGTGVADEETEVAQRSITAERATLSESPLMVKLSPNPATDHILVNITAQQPEAGEGTILIFSLTGQLMYEARLQLETGFNQMEIRINDLPDGLYLLQLRNGTQLQTVRFMKQWQ